MSQNIGLRRIGKVWHMDKVVRYGDRSRRIRGSTGCSNLDEATLVLAREIEKARDELLYGMRPSHTFVEAAERYLEDQRQAGIKSVERNRQNLNSIMPTIGHLPINEVHQGQIEDWIRKQRGTLRSGTIKRILRIVTAVLNQAARVYRDGAHPWLQTVPLLRAPNWNDERQAYPLSWKEQQALFDCLPTHLARMAGFALYTGARDQEVCQLRWEYEQEDVFVIPKRLIKNKEDRVLVIGSFARLIIESQRREKKTSPYVFPSPKTGDKLTKMGGKSWHKAWRDAGLPTDPDIRQGPHNLRHTFGRRLRAAGVGLETRRALLGHTTGDVTTHYSAAEIKELRNAIELMDMSRSESPLLRAVN